MKPLRLTVYTDYSLRVLMYLGAREPGQLSTIQEIADAYNISKKEYRDLGTFKNTSVTYPLTVKNLMRYLGEDVNLVQDENTISKIIEKLETKSMPSFPYKGYIQMDDKYLVIHF